MIKRRPFEYGVFGDIETVKKYDKENKQRTQRLSKSFISVVKKWEIRSGKILDIGCGTGLLAIEFAKNLSGVEIIGLDLSDVALEVGRENIRKSEVIERISFKKGDAEDIPFEDNTFNLVISSNTLHLIMNPIKMFNEIHRVLKPKGKFFISDFRRSWIGIFSRHVRASYSLKEVKTFLNQSELQNWKVKDYFFWLSIFSKV
jgi:ubiquinone/menaquinone biosynthesis C-methylase UbiE